MLRLEIQHRNSLHASHHTAIRRVDHRRARVFSCGGTWSRTGPIERPGALMAAVADRRLAPALPADDRIVGLARRHRLSPLLSQLADDTLPPPLAATFRRDRLMTVARNLMFSQAAEECIRALAAEGIPTIVLKGLAYEPSIYPGAGTRPTSDVDLLVPDGSGAARSAFSIGWGSNRRPPRRASTTPTTTRSPGPAPASRLTFISGWRRLPVATSTTARSGQRPCRSVGRHRHARAAGRPCRSLSRASHGDRSLRDPGDLSRRSGAVAADSRRRRRRHRAGARLALLAPVRDRNRAGGVTVAGLGAVGLPAPPKPALFSRRVIANYGAIPRLTRPEQLLRKFLHFDTPGHALRYLVVQSRRNIHELVERRVRHRSARERLSLSDSR